jgi:magnesium chelatase family protein
LERYLDAEGGVVEEAERAARKLSLSHRALVSVLRTARTIADLEEAQHTQRDHVLEAIQHRRLGEGASWL